MKRDLIKRAWQEFCTILENLPEDAAIISFRGEEGPLDSCRISVLTNGIDDRMDEEAAAWGERLVTKDICTDVCDYTRLSFWCDTVEIVAVKFKEAGDE